MDKTSILLYFVRAVYMYNANIYLCIWACVCVDPFIKIHSTVLVVFKYANENATCQLDFLSRLPILQ